MNKDINKFFGERVCELRQRQGITQEELAERCGLHRTYIGAIERGEKSPTLNTVNKIVKGLGITFNEIWEAKQTN